MYCVFSGNDVFEGHVQCSVSAVILAEVSLSSNCKTRKLQAANNQRWEDFAIRAFQWDWWQLNGCSEWAETEKHMYFH